MQLPPLLLARIPTWETLNPKLGCDFEMMSNVRGQVLSTKLTAPFRLKMMASRNNKPLGASFFRSFFG